MKNLAIMAGFNTIWWWLVIVAYFFGPPCSILYADFVLRQGTVIKTFVKQSKEWPYFLGYIHVCSPQVTNFSVEFCRKTSLPLPRYYRIIFTVPTVLQLNFPRSCGNYHGYRDILSAASVSFCFSECCWHCMSNDVRTFFSFVLRCCAIVHI